MSYQNNRYEPKSKVDLSGLFKLRLRRQAGKVTIRSTTGDWIASFSIVSYEPPVMHQPAS